MTAILAVLTGPLRSYILGALAVAALLAGAALWLHAHDAGLRATWDAQQRAATAQALSDAYKRGQDALAAVSATDAAITAASAPVQQEIARHAADPDPTASIAVALGELRQRASGGGADAHSAGVARP